MDDLPTSLTVTVLPAGKAVIYYVGMVTPNPDRDTTGSASTPDYLSDFEYAHGQAMDLARQASKYAYAPANWQKSITMLSELSRLWVDVAMLSAIGASLPDADEEFSVEAAALLADIRAHRKHLEREGKHGL